MRRKKYRKKCRKKEMGERMIHEKEESDTERKKERKNVIKYRTQKSIEKYR